MAFKVFRNGQEPAEEWTTLYRLLDTLPKGRHTFGSATTRRSTALGDDPAEHSAQTRRRLHRDHGGAAGGADADGRHGARWLSDQ